LFHIIKLQFRAGATRFPAICSLKRQTKLRDAFVGQYKAICECGRIYLNRAGSYSVSSETEEERWVRREEFVWPDFAPKDIRVKQYAGGRHWYSFIGDMPLYNNSARISFDTREEALDAAQKYVTNYIV
jgi:hypothetical protein